VVVTIKEPQNMNVLSIQGFMGKSQACEEIVIEI
jgi:hypothetical protein